LIACIISTLILVYIYYYYKVVTIKQTLSQPNQKSSPNALNKEENKTKQFAIDIKKLENPIKDEDKEFVSSQRIK
jgi:ABC-type uncharacterized transport system permease subunit